MCYKIRFLEVSMSSEIAIHQAPNGLGNPRETKAFAIGNRTGKWSITKVQIGNNFAHTVPREFGVYISVIAEECGFGRNQPVCE